MNRGPRNLRVAADGVGLTQFGGVALVEQFFQRIGLQGALWRHVRLARRNNRYSISESLKALLYPLVLGLRRIETNEPLRYNDVFHYLAGLLVYPEATSLRRLRPSYQAYLTPGNCLTGLTNACREEKASGNERAYTRN